MRVEIAVSAARHESMLGAVRLTGRLATSSSKAYALTRGFYAHLGFEPLEVFPLLWAPQNPCLQMIKLLPHA